MRLKSGIKPYTVHISRTDYARLYPTNPPKVVNVLFPRSGGCIDIDDPLAQLIMERFEFIRPLDDDAVKAEPRAIHDTEIFFPTPYPDGYRTMSAETRREYQRMRMAEILNAIAVEGNPYLYVKVGVKTVPIDEALKSLGA